MRAACALAPWLVFEALLLSVPVWAPDESYTTRGVFATAIPYFLFVGLPAVLLVLITARPGLLAGGTLVLTAAAAWAAVAMVASDDAQAGLAVLWVWFLAVPLLVLVGGVEVILSRRATTRAARVNPS